MVGSTGRLAGSTPSSAERTDQRRRHATARAAFTLIEMIVVLGIIMLLMGLALSGVFSNRKIDRLIATEQLIADVVRQARHAARSTGEPVVVEVRKDAREVAGVSRTPIRCEQFETQSASDPAIVPGRTGRGWQVDGSTLAPWTAALAPNEQLERSSSATHRSPGFYLACDVRTGPPTDVTPLVCVAADPVGTYGDSACGIALVPVVRRIQTTPTPAPPFPPVLTAWNVVGWIRTGAGETMIESEGDPIDLPLDRRIDVAQNTFAPTGDDDVFGAMTGGAWEDLGLLYDGERLVLYRNGQRIAEKPLDLSAGPAHLVASDTIVAGMVTGFATGSVTGGVPTTLPPAAQKYATNAVLDNVRLFRLTTDQVGVLPPGVSAKRDYRITAHPDGRVDVNARDELIADAGAGTGTLQTRLIDDAQRMYFTGTQDLDAAGSTLWGVITVQSNGRVTSEVRQLESTENTDQVVAP